MRVVDARGRVGRVVFAASFDGNEDGTRGKRETTRGRACFSFAAVAVARACGRDAVCLPPAGPRYVPLTFLVTPATPQDSSRTQRRDSFF